MIELLAVIAILAILVVIALPNVLKLFEQAKRERFLVEAQTVYQEVTKKYVKENMNGNKIDSISPQNNPLDLDGEDMDYCILVDNRGDVDKLIISNGDYFITGSNIKNVNSIKIDNVKEGKLLEYQCDKEHFSSIPIELPSGEKVTISNIDGNPTNPDSVIPPKTYNCKYDGELKPGVEFKNGPYTYRYKQEISKYDIWTEEYYFRDITKDGMKVDGWSVYLTDRDSTAPVTGEVCAYVNDKPIVSMSHMYHGSKTNSIDLSHIDTSNVINMSYMFSEIQALDLDLSNFDTHNVTNMEGMFYLNQLYKLDLSSFDTSNVTNMSCMFDRSELLVLLLGLDKFNTSKVTDMSCMFSSTNSLWKLDLSNFDTHNVTNMEAMFFMGVVDNLDLSSFDTSNVTNMRSMFTFCSSNKIDLSGFDTSKVTNMNSMFYDTRSLYKIVGLNDFDTSNVTNMGNMFYNCAVQKLDLSSFNTSKVTDMSDMFKLSQAYDGYARTQDEADKFNNKSNTSIPDTLHFVVKE